MSGLPSLSRPGCAFGSMAVRPTHPVTGDELAGSAFDVVHLGVPGAGSRATLCFPNYFVVRVLRDGGAAGAPPLSFLTERGVGFGAAYAPRSGGAEIGRWALAARNACGLSGSLRWWRLAMSAEASGGDVGGSVHVPVHRESTVGAQRPPVPTGVVFGSFDEGESVAAPMARLRCVGCLLFLEPDPCFDTSSVECGGELPAR